MILQDISKAFDSIDINMLEHAMDRLKIPKAFTKLTLALFTNRSNRVITANGLSDPYKVKIGIDQGEVISPLLWVIYIDPLLVALNNNNPSPYTISSSSNRPHINISTLAFMDDTTLISSTIDGITSMLNLANEFYKMNNTKINFTKAEQSLLLIGSLLILNCLLRFNLHLITLISATTHLTSLHFVPRTHLDF